MKIYYSPRHKHYFSDEIDNYCEKCNKIIEKIVFHCTVWWKKQTYEKTYCIKCIDKVKTEGIVMEERNVLISKTLPSDTYQVFIRPPTLIDGNRSLSDLSIQQVGDEVVKDETVHSHNPDFMKDPQFKPFDKTKVLEKDKPMNTQDGLDLFGMLAESKPAIEHDGKKRLDTKKG